MNNLSQRLAALMQDNSVPMSDAWGKLFDDLKQADCDLGEPLALREEGKEPVQRVNSDQMHRVCLEANRHLDKYIAMAKEVNKLLGRIPAPQLHAVPDLVPVPDEFLSAEQNQRGMFELSEDCMVRLASALAQQSKGFVVPPGWVMVPIEPTAEMLASAKEWTGLTSTASVVYNQMIAAAPKPE